MVTLGSRTGRNTEAFGQCELAPVSGISDGRCRQHVISGGLGAGGFPGDQVIKRGDGFIHRKIAVDVRADRALDQFVSFAHGDSLLTVFLLHNKGNEKIAEIMQGQNRHIEITPHQGDPAQSVIPLPVGVRGGHDAVNRVV